MAKYKIKCIAHSLKNNKIAKSGDIVDENAFVDLQESLKGGYCELVVEYVKEIEVSAEVVVDPKTMNKAKLIAYAKEIGLEIVETDSKAEILEQVLNHLS